jgi:hypothetical protein
MRFVKARMGCEGSNEEVVQTECAARCVWTCWTLCSGAGQMVLMKASVACCRSLRRALWQSCGAMCSCNALEPTWIRFQGVEQIQLSVLAC